MLIHTQFQYVDPTREKKLTQNLDNDMYELLQLNCTVESSQKPVKTQFMSQNHHKSLQNRIIAY